MTGSPVRSREHSSTLVNRENPWPGLAAFSEEHAEFFYGREREVDELFRRVRLNALSVLYGQSGLGKTSLVQAALFPRLRDIGILPVSIRVDYSAGAPAARLQICQAIGKAVQAAGGSAQRLGEQESLWEYFHRERPAAVDKSGKPMVIALAFDQFEEAFTLGSDRGDGRGFVRDLVEEMGSLAEHRPPSRVESAFERDPERVADFDFDRQDYRILVSLREDFLAHLHDLSERIPSITVNNMRLPPLDGSRALEVVERPGKGIVAPGAAEAIVRFVSDAGDERRDGTARKDDTGQKQITRPIETLEVDPSLLSLFCRELNEKRGAGLITPALVMASREKILSEFYERALADQHPGVRLFVEEDLLTAKGFRQTLSVDSAEDKLKEYGASPDAVSVLVNRRLLHFEQRGQQKRVELTHDVLTRVVRESRNERQAREAEEEKVREAEEAERRAQAARTRAEEERAAAERQVAALRKQQRLTRILLGVVALAAAASVGLAAFALNASRKAKLSEQEAVAQRQKAEASEGIAVAERKKAETSEAAALATTDSLKRVETSLQANRRALIASTRTAENNLQVAEAERKNSETMLTDFCAYGLTVINRFADSTRGNNELKRAYNSLVELSDTAVEKMVKRTPESVCPRRLDARVKSVSTGLLLDLADTSGARRRGNRGLEVARAMLTFGDSLSKSVTLRSFTDLNYNLFFAKDYTGSLAAGREALRLAGEIDPAHDTEAFDRRARLYHYGALAYLRLGQPAPAHAFVDSGLAVAAQGRRRDNQYQYGLLFTISQLNIREAEADTLRKAPGDSAESLLAYRRAVAAARERMALRHNQNSHTWLAQMHGWHGQMARQLWRFDESVTAYDSSAAQWNSYLRENTVNADTAEMVTALDNLVTARGNRARNLMILLRFDEAEAGARSLIDAADSAARLRPAFWRRHEQANAYGLLADIHEVRQRRATADSANRIALRIDSLNAFLSFPRADSATQVGAHDWWHDRAQRLSDLLTTRARIDTAGKPVLEQRRVLREAEEARRTYREQQAFAALRSSNMTRSGPARIGADSTLASDLGNLSWTYLLIGQPALAVQAAEEGMRRYPGLTFITVNYFSGLVLKNDSTAAAYFERNATRMVERPEIRFACAVVRDIRELYFRGAAEDRHVQMVERLAARLIDQCQNLPTFPAP